MTATYSPQAFIRLPSARLYLGLAAIALEMFLEFLLSPLPSDVGSFLPGRVAKGMLNYYLLMLLALVLYKIWKTGWDSSWAAMPKREAIRFCNGVGICILIMLRI